MIGSGISSAVSSQAKPKHHALIARAAGIHAHRDIGRLRLDQIMYAAGIGIESVGGVVVSDVFDGAARDARNVHVSLGGDLAGHDASAGSDQNLAGHAAGGVVGKNGVQHRVRYLVRDLVGMAFGDRFRSEKVSLIS
jgi:hypothetical protein